ncbi:MAG TPA: helix-turn-helix domain-containing protein [Pseudonocardiaceae bacterium]
MSTTRERRQRLGTLIRQARKRRKLSQANLATLANLSPNVVGAIERGGTYSMSSLEDVALVLDWRPGATERYLRGEEVVLEAEPPPPADEVAVARLEVLEASAQDLARIRRIIEEVHGPAAADAFLQAAITMREEHRSQTAARRPDRAS